MNSSIPTGISTVNSFYRMIDKLVSSNELVLFGQIDQIGTDEESQVVDLIKKVYLNEAIDYPFAAPSFHPDSALWSAKVLFHAAQLLIYREQRPDKLDEIIVHFNGVKTSSAILSSDICLRFLPKLIAELELIDVEDALIPILKDVMITWHYSGLLSKVKIGEPDFSDAFDDPCLLQCYVNRVIQQKQKIIGNLEKIRPSVLSALGAFDDVYWKGFK